MKWSVGARERNQEQIPSRTHTQANSSLLFSTTLVNYSLLQLIEVMYPRVTTERAGLDWRASVILPTITDSCAGFENNSLQACEEVATRTTET